ncbi:MAG: hypothetical protein RL021_2107 [Bacteroidota bacterium]|jgi:dienelactone hydrolase
MKRTLFAFLILLGTLLPGTSPAQLTITFSAPDGVTVSAEWYPIGDNLPVILLCHQNRYSRGEYKEVALRLNKFGFNCLAVDQRVGEEVNGVVNLTAVDAMERGLEPIYEDAEQDIVSAVNWLYERYQKPVIIIGSSYSASLGLKIANENDHVYAAIAFSPGEYFSDNQFTEKAIQGMAKPVMMFTSASQAPTARNLMESVNSVLKSVYVSQGEQDHGAKILWSDYPGNEKNWSALMAFLDKLRYLD